MMSPQVIDDIARKAAKRSRAAGNKPVTITQESKDAAILALKEGRHPDLHIPFIGDWIPKGYRPTGDTLFVDSSGFGTKGEPALTVEEFTALLQPGLAYAIFEAGQFQVNVREFYPPNGGK